MVMVFVGYPVEVLMVTGSREKGAGVPRRRRKSATIGERVDSFLISYNIIP